MQISKVSDILPVMLKEMRIWKQKRGKKKKKKTQHKTNNQLVYKEDHSSCMTSRNGMGRDSLAQVRAPNTHSLPTGVTISSANNLLDKNITSALLPQTDE